MRRSAVRGAVLALVLTLCPALGLAQTSAPGHPDDARIAIETGKEGLVLFEQERWSEALQRFRQAEALYHSPVFVLYTARALRKIGRLLEAREVFRALVAEPLGPSAPELWTKAQSDAVTELRALDAELPKVVIDVQHASAATRVSVDERAVVPAQPLELDPGAHRVVVTDGARHAVRDFTLTAGALEQHVVVTLPAVEQPAEGSRREPVERSAEGGRPNHAEPVRHDEAGPNVPALIVVGVGATTLVAGGVVGVLALNKKADVENSLPESCRGHTCPPSVKADVEPAAEDARNLGSIADILFVGGAAVTVAGLGLWIFTAPGEPAVAVQVSPRAAQVRMVF